MGLGCGFGRAAGIALCALLVAATGGCRGRRVTRVDGSLSSGGAASRPVPLMRVQPRGVGGAPQTFAGRAGGPIAASSMHQGCAGFVSAQPNLELDLALPLPYLKLLVATAGDATLVVVSQDGRILCNDDAEWLNPAVAAAFRPGRYRVWVGTFDAQDVGLPFVLGVSTQEELTTAALVPELVRRGGAVGAVPSECGLEHARYGPVLVGRSVVLGRHTPYTGPDGEGGAVSADDNWADDMDAHVGQETVVSSLEGLDQAGCPVVHVAIDGEQFYWRIRDMAVGGDAPVTGASTAAIVVASRQTHRDVDPSAAGAEPTLASPPRETWRRVDGSQVPTGCGMAAASYGPVVIGSVVRAARHSAYTGPDGVGGYASMDDNWSPGMDAFVGQETVVTALGGLDASGCPVVRIAADGGRFFWRIRNMQF